MKTQWLDRRSGKRTEAGVGRPDRIGIFDSRFKAEGKREDRDEWRRRGRLEAVGKALE